MKLLAKISLILIGGIGTSLLVAGILNFIQTRASWELSISDRQEHIAKDTISEIDRFLYERYLDIQSIGDDSTLETFLTTKGKQLSGEEVQKRLKELASKLGPWDTLSLVNTEGDIVASTAEEEVGKNIDEAPSNSEAFKQIRSGKSEVYYSDVMMSNDTGKPVMMFATALRNENQTTDSIIGVVIGSFPWENVQNILIDTETSSELNLYTKEGKLIATNLHPLDLLYKETPSVVPIITEALATRLPVVTRGPDAEGGEEELWAAIASTGYLGYQGNNWVLSVEQSVRSVFAQATTQATQSAITLGIGFLIALGAVLWFLSRFVISRIVSLAQLADTISKGDLSRRISVRSEDELGQLATAFNGMADKLQESYTGLEKKVADKTQELSTAVKNLAQRSEEMEKSKSAMLNLLEDTKFAEDAMKKKSEELKNAIEQIGKFASNADQQRNLYMLLLSSIGEGVFVLDMARKITIINKAAESIFSYTAEELLGRPFDELVRFVHADKKALENSVWDDTFKSRSSSVFPNDISVIAKDGTVIPVVIVVAPIIEKTSGEVQGLIVTFRDVREERALEEARIGFISIASHQLRTPLTSMRWFSEMLIAGDAGKLNEDQRKFIDRIYQGTDRMISLVNLLLQIARVEAGRLRIQPTLIDLKNIVRGVTLSLKSFLDAKSQPVDVTSTPDPFPTIPMDQEVIWQVFQNLISNASRYGPEKVAISIAMSQKEEMAEVTVSDNGIGIPKDERERIFEKFFRAENALRLVPEGSGLGLSLVKSLVEGWGGKIWFESEEGRGTTFYFTIPLAGMKARGGEVGLKV